MGVYKGKTSKGLYLTTAKHRRIRSRHVYNYSRKEKHIFSKSLTPCRRSTPHSQKVQSPFRRRTQLSVSFLSPVRRSTPHPVVSKRRIVSSVKKISPAKCVFSQTTAQFLSQGIQKRVLPDEFRITMTSTNKCIVLVTGGSGFLGQHVIGLLQTRAPHVTEIRVIDLPSNPYTNKLDYKAPKPVIQFLGNITDEQLLRKACQGVNCVMHIAGVIDVSLFPDIDRLTRVNVLGTSVLLEVCKELGVGRFIYCSTLDVVCGSDDIINGTETSTSTPDVFFFGGYASTKQKAEELVLAANCESLRTVSIRPITMYGEEDNFTVAEPLKMARKFGRWSRFDCKNNVHQMAYAGNVAWAFICADKTLIKDHNNIIGGKAFFASDETPMTDIFEFQDPFARVCGFSTNTFRIPVWVVLYPLYVLYVLMWLISFFVSVNLRVGFSSFKYMLRTFTFSSENANKELGYSPIYSYDQAMKRSIQYYSKKYNILSKSKQH